MGKEGGGEGGRRGKVGLGYLGPQGVGNFMIVPPDQRENQGEVARGGSRLQKLCASETMVLMTSRKRACFVVWAAERRSENEGHIAATQSG